MPPHGGHGHSHSCGGESHGIASEDAVGLQYALYQKINLDGVECLNEAEEGSGKKVFKTWQDRKDRTKVYITLIRFFKARMYEHS